MPRAHPGREARFERAHAEAEVGGPLERLGGRLSASVEGLRRGALQLNDLLVMADGTADSVEVELAGKGGSLDVLALEATIEPKAGPRIAGLTARLERADKSVDVAVPEIVVHRSNDRRRCLRGPRRGRADTRGDPSLSRSATSQGRWTGCRSDAAFRVRLVHFGMAPRARFDRRRSRYEPSEARRAARTSDSRKRESVRRPRSPPYSMHRSTVHVPTGGS